MLRRPHYIALGLVVLMTLTLLNLPSRTTARLKLAVGSFFAPLFGLTNAGHSVAEQAGDSVTSRGELIRQNEALRRENQELRLENNHSKEVDRENARLRQLLAWQQQKPWKMKLASVVAREPANWWRTVQIDLGTRDGVRVNLPVMTVDGLVGRISSVGLTRSQVVLLGDPNCRVSALVENETRVSGVIVPSGPLGDTLVEMAFLPPNANVKPGQNVVTSGNGGIFPKEIPIGKIVDAHPAEFGLSMEARVKLAANLTALEEVWVLTEPLPK
jgi:rod shape-determining protein MreC